MSSEKLVNIATNVDTYLRYLATPGQTRFVAPSRKLEGAPYPLEADLIVHVDGVPTNIPWTYDANSSEIVLSNGLMSGALVEIWRRTEVDESLVEFPVAQKWLPKDNNKSMTQLLMCIQELWGGIKELETTVTSKESINSINSITEEDVTNQIVAEVPTIIETEVPTIVTTTIAPVISALDTRVLELGALLLKFFIAAMMQEVSPPPLRHTVGQLTEGQTTFNLTGFRGLKGFMYLFTSDMVYYIDTSDQTPWEGDDPLKEEIAEVPIYIVKMYQLNENTTAESILLPLVTPITLPEYYILLYYVLPPIMP